MTMASAVSRSRSAPTSPRSWASCRTVQHRPPTLGQDRLDDLLDLRVPLGRVDEQREQLAHPLLGLGFAKRSNRKRRSPARLPVSGVGCSTTQPLAAAEDQALPAAEVAVERGLGDARAGRHLLERDALDAGREQQLDGGVERGAVRVLTSGSGHES